MVAFPRESHERRQALIAAGLCVRCTERPPAPDRASCQDCLAFDRARNMRRRERFIAAGRCAQCGKQPPRVGTKTCVECGSAHLKARAAGLCCRCRHEPAIAGAFCLACKKAHTKWEANQVASGGCIKCSAKAVKGLLHCQDCRVADRVRTRARTKKLRAHGLCRICAEPSFGKSRCADCQKNHAKQSKIRRAELTAAGLCETCGKRPRLLVYKGCEECLVRKQSRKGIRTPEQILADRARAKRFREQVLAAGRCYRCCVKPFLPGLKTCAKCREIQRVRNAIVTAHRKQAKKASMVETKRQAKQEANRRNKVARKTASVCADE